MTRTKNAEQKLSKSDQACRQREARSETRNRVPKTAAQRNIDFYEHCVRTAAAEAESDEDGIEMGRRSVR